jgi:hypothetical protein
MYRHFYALFLFIFLFGHSPARAQDSATCTAQFFASGDGFQFYFRAVDSVTGVQHFWSFGDSTQVGYGNFVGVQHTYGHYGSFTVTHVVVNPAVGCRDSSVQNVSIGAPPPQCGISFYFSRDSTVAPNVYSFYPNTYLAGASIDTVTWTVNGTVAGTADTLIRNFQPGTYTVCVNLNTNTGCRTQSCQTVVVTDSAPTPPVVTPPVTVTPNDSTVTPPDSTMTPIDTIGRNRSDSTAGSNLSSYPNPTSGQVRLDVPLDQPGMIYIRIYNSMGSQVQATSVSGYQGVNHVDLPLSDLATGIYYIQVQYGNTIRRSKVQKL